MKQNLCFIGAFILLLFSAGMAAAAPAITTASLNVRNGPGTRYAVRFTLPARAPVDVRSCSGNWCQLSYGSQIGWASSRYLAFRQGRDVYDSYNPNASIGIGAGALVTGIVIGSQLGPRYHHPRRHYRPRHYYRPRPHFHSRPHYRPHRYHGHRPHYRR